MLWLSAKQFFFSLFSCVAESSGGRRSRRRLQRWRRLWGGHTQEEASRERTSEWPHPPDMWIWRCTDRPGCFRWKKNPRKYIKQFWACFASSVCVMKCLRVLWVQISDSHGVWMFSFRVEVPAAGRQMQMTTSHISVTVSEAVTCACLYLKSSNPQLRLTFS